MEIYHAMQMSQIKGLNFKEPFNDESLIYVDFELSCIILLFCKMFKRSYY